MPVREKVTADEVLSLAASGELHARHPLTRAIVVRTDEQRLHVPIYQAREVGLGMGVRVERDGTRLLVGSHALLRQHGVNLTEDAQSWAERLRASGETVISSCDLGSAWACTSVIRGRRQRLGRPPARLR
ncbi:hypothetical protein ACFW6F_12740 [Streptomyces sp. NPDC058746]|uniref:hypothetical protein n=1 Tax=Streptomyces sp. NPDC058746 TaxID=3346622 RepID=UPI00367479AE